MDLTNFTIGKALMVAVSGFLVVFLMLLILWMLIVVTSKVIQKITGKKTPEPASAPAAQPAQIRTENDDDLVLITAAIASYLSTSTDQLVVRSIRKVNDNQSAWKTAARLQNHVL
ncbi:MAG: OadG family protein [Solobacterium sp.]|nr:OadG family protein [Solobacterium sp.]